MDNLNGQPAISIQDWMKWCGWGGRGNPHKNWMTSMDNPHVRMKKNDAEKELDPRTKFLQTIRAWADINKMMTIWDR